MKYFFESRRDEGIQSVSQFNQISPTTMGVFSAEAFMQKVTR